jgi:hypothetical protein
MSSVDPFQRPDRIVRFAFALASVVFGLLGLTLRSGRLLAAAGICGVVWTVWDVLWDRWVEPAGTWTFRALTEGIDEEPSNTLPTLDDTIRLLEHHLAGEASRHVRIQAALRLEEIYRTVRKDPTLAEDVLNRALALYPDAPELLARRAAAAGSEPA